MDNRVVNLRENISKYINTTSREKLAMCPKSEWQYQTYMSRAQEFCFFFTSYHWFFSLIVGHWNTLDCPNCPSSHVFYDRLKWEIYAFYRQNGQAPGDNFQKKRDSRLSMKIYNRRVQNIPKKGMRFVEYASIIENNFINPFDLSFIYTTRDRINMKRHTVIYNSHLRNHDEIW